MGFSVRVIPSEERDLALVLRLFFVRLCEILRRAQDDTSQGCFRLRFRCSPGASSPEGKHYSIASLEMRFSLIFIRSLLSLIRSVNGYSIASDEIRFSLKSLATSFLSSTSGLNTIL